MATQSVGYDHSAYLMRSVMYLGATAASASGTNAQYIAPTDMRLRRANGVVITAGTTATNTLTARIGTTSIGLLTFADSAAGFEATTGDMDVTLTQGNVFNLLKGTDATGVVAVTLEWHYPVGTALIV